MINALLSEIIDYLIKMKNNNRKKNKNFIFWKNIAEWKSKENNFKLSKKIARQ
jgi:hypothetical protein